MIVREFAKELHDRPHGVLFEIERLGILHKRGQPNREGRVSVKPIEEFTVATLPHERPHHTKREEQVRQSKWTRARPADHTV